MKRLLNQAGDAGGDGAAAEPEVNTSALIAPEGVDTEELRGTTISGAPDYTPPDLNQGGGSQPPDEGGGDAGGDEGGGNGAADEGAAAAAQDPDYFRKPFEDLKKIYGESFEVPEDLTPENYLEKLSDTFYKGIDLSKMLPEEVHNVYKDMREKDITFQEAIKDYREIQDLSNAEPRQLLQQHYKDKYELTEEQAAEHVSKLSDIDAKIQSKQVLEERQAGLAAEQAKKAEEQKTLRFQEEQKISTQRKQQVAETLNMFSKVDNVFGIPVSEADKTEFAANFEKLVTPDPTTQVAPFAEALQSNETIAQIAFLMIKGNAFGKGALTRAKEATKEKIINGLDGQPRKSTSGHAADADPNKIDREALLRPEGMTIGPASKTG